MEKHVHARGFSVETQAHGIKMPSMHHHDQYELYYLDAGSREYFVEDSFFSVSAGDFVLIAPGKLHRTGGTYALRILVMFSRDCLESVYTPDAADTLLKCFDSLHIVPPKEQQASLRALLKRMENCESKLEFSVYLANLLCALSKCREETSCDPLISRIIRYINQNYSTIRSIDEIAQACYLSKYYLCHAFRQAMGIPVIDYLNQVRIKTACVHLAAKRTSIQDIASQCGYHSVAYFSTIFKKYTGTTPSQYRIQKTSPD